MVLGVFGVGVLGWLMHLHGHPHFSQSGGVATASKSRSSKILETVAWLPKEAAVKGVCIATLENASSPNETIARMATGVYQICGVFLF